MPIRITQIENSHLESGIAECPGEPSDVVISSTDEPRVFKVEGTLHLKDAELLEGICRRASAQTGRPVTIELNDVCFVDSDSAAVICRMKRENIVIIEGLNLFIRKVMELVDESEYSGEAKCS